MLDQISEMNERMTRRNAPLDFEAGKIPADYEGVRGWLLVFCVVRTILAPIFNAALVAYNYQKIEIYFAFVSGMRSYFLLSSFLSLAITAFGVYVGIALWTRKPGAVSAAKDYLFISLCNSIFALLLHSMMVETPPGANQSYVAETLQFLVLIIAPFAVWFTYFNRSKRVKATYGDEEGAAK